MFSHCRYKLGRVLLSLLLMQQLAVGSFVPAFAADGDTADSMAEHCASMAAGTESVALTHTAHDNMAHRLAEHDHGDCVDADCTDCIMTVAYISLPAYGAAVQAPQAERFARTSPAVSCPHPEFLYRPPINS